MLPSALLVLLLSPSDPLLETPAPLPPLAEGEEAGKWSGTVNFSFDSTSGNSKKLVINTDADATRRGENDRWTLKGFYRTSQQGDVTEERKVGTSAKYDYFATEKLYYLGNGTWEKDMAANLDPRITVGGGLGYQFFEREDSKFSAEAGLNFIDEQFRSGGDDSYTAARAAYDYQRVLTESADFKQSAEIFPNVSDVKDVYSKLTSRVSIALSERLNGHATWVWDWDNTPIAGAENSDHQVTIGIGWSF
jgi:putative salt-induced outer membrane protein YdiY